MHSYYEKDALGYVVFGYKAANNVYTQPYYLNGGTSNAGVANTNNLANLPSGVSITCADSNIGMWSGNGNFGQMQNPDAGNTLDSTPILANSNGPRTFTISRPSDTGYRITLITASGDGANATFSPSVNDGSGAASTSHQHTANGVVYHVFDVSPGSGNITVAMSASVNWSLTGIAFDTYVAPPTGPDLVWTGANGAWDTSTTGNWMKASDSSAAVFSNSPPNPVLFNDTGSVKAVDISSGDVTPAGTTFNSAADYTVQGTNGIGGLFGLTKSGSGTLVLENPNTYAGPTNINAGTLRLSGAGSLGGGSYGGSVTNNGEFSYLGAGTQTLSGTISGSGPVIQGGTGTLRLGNANTFTGNVTVSAGTLAATVGMSSAAATCFGDLTVTGKTITVGSGATLRHDNNDLYFNGSGNHDAAKVAIILDGGTMNTGSYYSAIKTLDLHSGATVTGTNGVVNPFRSLALCGTVTCAGGTGVVSTMTAPGASGGFHLGHSAFGVSGTTFHVDAASGGLDVPGPLVNQSNSMAAGSLTKTGDGILTLSGSTSHSYTGATTVNAGTLSVTGTLASSTAGVTVNNSATLTGNGFINRPVTINSGGNLTPGGPAIDILSTGDLMLAAGSKTVCQIDKSGGVTTQDLLDTTAVTYGGTLEVVATGEPIVLGDTFKLFNAGTTYTGAFSSTSLPVLTGGLQWDLSNLIVDGTITVVNTAAAPVFNPSSGGYIGATSVTMTSSPGTTIHYTNDGTDPKTSGTVISGASPLIANIPTDTETVTLTAYASQSGFGDSTNVSATYSTITTPVWNVDDNGDWSDTTKWKYGVVASGAGATADFNTTAQSTDTIITLDGSRTIGLLVVGNANPFNWTLNGSGGSVLTLAAPGTPVIDVTSQTASIGAPVSGSQGFGKTGDGTLRLTHGESDYTGDLTVSGGALVAIGSTGGINPTRGSLGNPRVVRNITVGAGSTLSFGAHDILGNHNSDPLATLVVENGGTVTSTGNIFTVLGPVTLGGGTIHGQDGANATFPSFGLKGSVTALTGTSSLMSASGTNGAYHLGDGLVTGTVFDTVGTGVLEISGQLRDGRESNYTVRPSDLTKTGSGTLTLSGINTYTGNTTVNAGTLAVADNAQLRFVIGDTSGVSNQLSGAGTVTLDGDFAIDTTAAGALTSGTWLLENVPGLTGGYGATFSVVEPDGTPWTNAGSNKWTKDAGSGRTWTFDETTGTLTLAAGANFASWASANGVTGGPNGDSDLDGIPNLVEYALNLNPAASDGSAGTFGGNVLSFTKRAEAATNGDVTYSIQESDDLGITDAWTTATPTTDTATTISYTLPVGGTKKFARLVITQNP
ncbi:MAG: autotransporter-associated beta strand repeat-containing protein [Verrucomicrobia bacterium]|nr:autotransporter-associated beta strand repeat-containing protein [Verrucomicrobiota bacterium]